MSDEEQKPTIDQVVWVLRKLREAQQGRDFSVRDLICGTMGFDDEAYTSLIEAGGLDADIYVNESSETDLLACQVAALREACQEALDAARYELYSERYYGGSPEGIEEVLSDVLGKQTPGELKAEAVEKQLRAAHRVLGYACHTAQYATRASHDACECGYLDALKAYRQAQKSFPI